MKKINLCQVQTSERFYRIPKVLIENEYYAQMSMEAKFAYAILKDRFELSVKNNWVDEENNVYLIYTVAELQKILGYGNKKVIKIKQELASYDLLEEERLGLNKPNRLYLGMIDPTKSLTQKPEDAGKCESDTSKSVKVANQEMFEGHSNDTELSDTEFSEFEEEESVLTSDLQEGKSNLIAEFPETLSLIAQISRIAEISQEDKKQLSLAVCEEAKRFKEKSGITDDYQRKNLFSMIFNTQLANQENCNFSERYVDYFLRGLKSLVTKEIRIQVKNQESMNKDICIPTRQWRKADL